MKKVKNKIITVVFLFISYTIISYSTKNKTQTRRYETIRPDLLHLFSGWWILRNNTVLEYKNRFFKKNIILYKDNDIKCFYYKISRLKLKKIQQVFHIIVVRD